MPGCIGNRVCSEEPERPPGRCVRPVTGRQDSVEDSGAERDYMRANQSGRIINTSSIAGKCAVLFGGWYNVSKYAVEAFSDALRIEVRPLGIDVSIIEPGGIKTNWGIIAAENLERSSTGTAYEESGMNMATTLRYAYNGNLLSGPRAVAKAISRAVNARRPRIRYRVGMGSGAMIVMHSLLPARYPRGSGLHLPYQRRPQEVLRR